MSGSRRRRGRLSRRRTVSVAEAVAEKAEQDPSRDALLATGLDRAIEVSTADPVADVLDVTSAPEVEDIAATEAVDVTDPAGFADDLADRGMGLPESPLGDIPGGADLTGGGPAFHTDPVGAGLSDSSGPDLESPELDTGMSAAGGAGTVADQDPGGAATPDRGSDSSSDNGGQDTSASSASASPPPLKTSSQPTTDPSDSSSPPVGTDPDGSTPGAGGADHPVRDAAAGVWSFFGGGTKGVKSGQGTIGVRGDVDTGAYGPTDPDDVFTKPPEQGDTDGYDRVPDDRGDEVGAGSGVSGSRMAPSAEQVIIPVEGSSVVDLERSLIIAEQLADDSLREAAITNPIPIDGPGSETGVVPDDAPLPEPGGNFDDVIDDPGGA